MEKKRRVIDQRNKQKYQMDDAYLNGYARLCGWKATIVYMSLCRHADIAQYCFPSIDLMAEQHKVSRDTIIDGLKTLKQWNIIDAEKVRSANGVWKNNAYILLDKSVWKEKPNQVDISNLDNQVDISLQPSRRQPPDQVAVVDSKETHKKEDTYKETHNLWSFDLFWSLYPKKKKKKQSKEKWNKLSPSKQEKAIKDIPLRIKSDDWKKDNGKFIPDCTTYLNGERWEDEINQVEISNERIIIK